jgi:hypothetical protein
MVIFNFTEIMVIAHLYAATHKISFNVCCYWYVAVSCIVIEKATPDFQASCLSNPNCSVIAAGPDRVVSTAKTTGLTDTDDQTENRIFSHEGFRPPLESIKTKLQQCMEVNG